MKSRKLKIMFLTALLCILLCGCNIEEVKKTYNNLSDPDWTPITSSSVTTESELSTEEYTIYEVDEPETVQESEAESKTEASGKEQGSIPKYNGHLSIDINGNKSNLKKEDASAGAFIRLSELDSLGRCGTAYMCAGPETLPTEERGEIGHVRPSGWHTVKYPEVIPDRYLYNRSHLLMYALSGLNDDERNLITGTRQFNADQDAGMLHYENIVLDYIKETGNHVLYKVTPVFAGDNLVADGVLMEALSVEDDQVSFCVFVYNVQDGVNIDYKTGESELAE